MRIERLVDTYDLEVEWIHFPLHPDTPPEGMSLADLFAGRNFDLDAAKARLHQVAESQGLALGDRTHTYNSRLAQELASWADEIQPGSRIHDALFAAYFVDGLNLYDLDALMGVVGDVGLPSDQAREVLAERRYKSLVDEHWQQSRNAGVTGVPTFVAGGLAVVGAQPYDVLQRLVLTAGAEIRQPRDPE